MEAEQSGAHGVKDMGRRWAEGTNFSCKLNIVYLTAAMKV